MSVKGRKVIAVVPARSGSKGLVGKNVRLVRGVPLVSRTLRASLGATLVDETWLSSDSAEILAIGEREGVHCITRPAAAASDQATAVDVVDHFIGQLPAAVLSADPVLVYLQPTSPLRDSRHIDEALRLLDAEGVESVMSIVENSHSPYKFFRLDDSGLLMSLFEEALSNARRQDLPRTFRPNGAIYAFTVSAYRRRGGFPSNGATPYLMDETASIDVDTIDDLLMVERALGPDHA